MAAPIPTLIECSKAVRPFSNGILTTKLQKRTMRDGTIQAQLKLRFVRNSDKKAYILTQSDETLRALNEVGSDPMEIADWLVKRASAVPSAKECVMVLCHKDSYTNKKPIILVLIEEIDSTIALFQEEKKTIANLTSRLSDLGRSRDQDAEKARTEASAERALLVTELDALKLEHAKVKAGPMRDAISCSPELEALSIKLGEEMAKAGITPSVMRKKIFAGLEAIVRAELEQLAGPRVEEKQPAIAAPCEHLPRKKGRVRSEVLGAHASPTDQFRVRSLAEQFEENAKRQRSE